MDRQIDSGRTDSCESQNSYLDVCSYIVRISSQKFNFVPEIIRKKTCYSVGKLAEWPSMVL